VEVQLIMVEVLQRQKIRYSEPWWSRYRIENLRVQWEGGEQGMSPSGPVLGSSLALWVMISLRAVLVLLRFGCCNLR
jgi:hypothetical protein